MRILIYLCAAAVLACVAPSEVAAQTTLPGTVAIVAANNPTAGGPVDGSLTFVTFNGITPPSGCGSTAYFAFSSDKMPSKEARDRTVTLLLFAKATGATVLVQYPTGPVICDTGYPTIYRVFLQ